MKKMRVLLLATLMGAAVSGQAFADDTSGQSGALTFTANVSTQTCSIQNPSQTLPVGEVGVNNYASMGKEIKFHVTGCDQSTTPHVMMSSTFTPLRPGLATLGYAKNDGTAVVDIVLRNTGDLKNSNPTSSVLGSQGGVLTADVDSSGNAVFPIGVTFSPSGNIPSNMKPGTIDVPVTLSFAYQ
ncbi:MAG: fimbrial protein [Serratia bockelmannii]